MDPSPKQFNDHDPLSQEFKDACQILTDNMFEVFIDLKNLQAAADETVTAPHIPYGPDQQAFLSVRLSRHQEAVRDGFIALVNPHDERDNMFAKITGSQLTQQDGSPLSLQRIISHLDRMGPDPLRDGVTYDNTAMRDLAAADAPTMERLVKVLSDQIIPMAHPDHIKIETRYTFHQENMMMVDMSKNGISFVDTEEANEIFAALSKDTPWSPYQGRTTTLTALYADGRLSPQLTLEMTMPCMYNDQAARVIATATLSPDQVVAFRASITQGDIKRSVIKRDHYAMLVAEMSFDLWGMRDEQAFIS